ncbi:glycosyltransferase [Williamsia herbipolensis]|uniref:glycosyltransferase n=1 Tax=Williamsia herbipolensis TaxID=1603258 RepID=UPI0005F79E04|nr:nucleotide disphospho-sugar-binding domain-containing protein [Williamsia herbipolensis]
MRVAFALNGSRGDVQPGLAVAKALTERGHDVAVGVPENLLDFAGEHGVDATVFAPDTADLLASPLVQRDLKSRNPRTRSRALREVTGFGATAMDERFLEISDGADLVVTGLMGQERAATIAEYRGARYVPLHYCPIRPSRSVPVPLGPLAHLAAVPRLSVAVWRGVELAYWHLSANSSDAALRKRLGMAPASGPLADRLADAETPEIQAYEPGLFPRLADEWGAHRPMTGFLTTAPDSADTGANDAATSAWIDAGPAPVYVGFGSMPLTDAAATVGAVVEALRDRGRRVLVGAGPNLAALTEPGSTEPGSIDASPDVRVVGSADHASVLPRCAAAIHHGGAGTTGASLRAGLPTLVAAFSADQPMWGRAIVDSGLGATCPVGRLTDPAVLASALSAILDDDVANRCAVFAGAMIDPDTAANAAVETMESAL